MAGGYSRSQLIFFDGETEATLEHGSVVATNDFYAGKFTVTLAAGAFLNGSLDAGGAPYELGPGWLTSVGLSWRVLNETTDIPYVVLSTTLGGLGTRTMRNDERGDYYGIDFRFGGSVGKTFAGWFSPYAALRVFGGPVLWVVNDETIVGTDKFHVQGSLGAVFLLPQSLDFFFEGSPGGEQGVFGGFGVRY